MKPLERIHQKALDAIGQALDACHALEETAQHHPHYYAEYREYLAGVRYLLNSAQIDLGSIEPVCAKEFERSKKATKPLQTA